LLLLWAGVLLAASGALGAAENPRPVMRAVVPNSSTIVVVAEGDFEPRSVGSYSLRVYAGRDPRFPHDDFIDGLVRPRDGTVEEIRFADLDDDGSPEIVVVVRSPGTGSLLSADAFRLQGRRLTLLASISALPRDADPVHALRAKLATR
jgi:hypothetical protein